MLLSNTLDTEFTRGLEAAIHNAGLTVFGGPTREEANAMSPENIAYDVMCERYFLLTTYYNDAAQHAICFGLNHDTRRMYGNFSRAGSFGRQRPSFNPFRDRGIDQMRADLAILEADRQIVPPHLARKAGYAIFMLKTYLRAAEPVQPSPDQEVKVA